MLWQLMLASPKAAAKAALESLIGSVGKPLKVEDVYPLLDLVLGQFQKEPQEMVEILKQVPLSRLLPKMLLSLKLVLISLAL